MILWNSFLNVFSFIPVALLLGRLLMGKLTVQELLYKVPPCPATLLLVVANDVNLTVFVWVRSWLKSLVVGGVFNRQAYTIR